MNATLHLPNMNSTRISQPIRLISVFAAILITIRGLLGPDEEAEDDPAALAYVQQKYGAVGD